MSGFRKEAVELREDVALISIMGSNIGLTCPS